jgi:hypothetical protein
VFIPPEQQNRRDPSVGLTYFHFYRNTRHSSEWGIDLTLLALSAVIPNIFTYLNLEMLIRT